MVFDPFTLIMLAVLAVLIIFMFRNSRKRQAEARNLQAKVVPGAQVMTNFGLYATIVSIDEEENKVELEVSPGNIITVHRQTVARVIEPAVVEDDEAEATAVDGEPEYGERIESTSDDTTDTKKSDD